MESWFLLLVSGLAILTIGNIIAFFVVGRCYFRTLNRKGLFAILLMMAFYGFVALSYALSTEWVTYLSEDGLGFFVLIAYLLTGMIDVQALVFRNFLCGF